MVPISPLLKVIVVPFFLGLEHIVECYKGVLAVFPELGVRFSSFSLSRVVLVGSERLLDPILSKTRVVLVDAVFLSYARLLR